MKEVIIALLVLSSLVLAAGDLEKAALDSILQSKEDMAAMQKAGFAVTLVNDTLKEMENGFWGQNYTKIMEEADSIKDAEKRMEMKRLILLSERTSQSKPDYQAIIDKGAYISEVKQKAFAVNDIMLATEARLNELKEIADVTSSEEVLTDAKKEFQSESYDKAELLADKAYKLAEEEAAEITKLSVLYKSSRKSFTEFVQVYWKTVLVTAISAIIVGTITYVILSRVLKKRKLVELKLEKEVLIELMKKAQEERFEKGDITQGVYELKSEKFKDRLSEIEKTIRILEEKVEK